MPYRGAVPTAAWTPPTRRRVRAVRDRLRAVYGIPRMAPHGDALAELVLTVLSQSTNDRNRDVAYLRLRARLATWEAVRDAPLARGRGGDPPGRHLEGEVRRIQSILRAISSRMTDGDTACELSLEWLARPAGAGTRLPDQPSRRRAQDGGMRVAVCIRLAGCARGHPRVARRDASGAAARGRAVRGATRPDARAHPSRRGAGAARQPPAPRPPHLSRAQSRLRRMRAGADVSEPVCLLRRLTR